MIKINFRFATIFGMKLIIYHCQVILLWQRAVNDPGFKRIFCLVHAEKLSYQICDRVVEALKELTQGRQGLMKLNVLKFTCS